MARKQTLVELQTEAGARLLTGNDTPWQIYPRPRLQRDSYHNLNGFWEFTVSDSDTLPDRYDRTIRVPFPTESVLSGVQQHFPEGTRLWYRREFALPEGFCRERTLLHIGAADQKTAVYLNGRYIGGNAGGYHHMTFELTDALAKKNILVICVTDDLRDRSFPYGKQTRKRGGMWYTPVSGIWQTVWLESVPAEYVRELHVRASLTEAEITAVGVETGTVTVQTPEGEITVPLEHGKALVSPAVPRLWSPESPYLYRFSVKAPQDEVRSYFALRTLDTRTVDGLPRLCLNGTPYFFHGLLDQGYWPDGLYTPAEPECYAQDILAMKKLGFNTLRKHIKVEPDQFYYDCDRLGMVVFQDMVNNGKYSFLRDTALPTVGLQKRSDRHLHRDNAVRSAFLRSMEQTVQQLRDFPCICYWTIFNEGWGQFDSQHAFLRLRELDDSRFIDTASGWFRCSESDVESLHIYFRSVRLKPSDRPLVLSEFGGYSCKPEGHAFNLSSTYGYRDFARQPDFMDALERLYLEQIVPAREQGLCAAIYTQVSDVEDETNGLLSYDRKVCKVEETRMHEIAKKLKY